MKSFAPAAQRNRGPILDVLRGKLPATGTVLEIASGSGQHAAFFSEHLPSLFWQPSDVRPEALDSIEAWRADFAGPNLCAAIRLDVLDLPWAVSAVDAVVCINMIHVAPWEATAALFEGAAGVLDAGRPLITYGPYRVDGQHTAPTNATFDQSLRARNPQWGIRDVATLRELGRATGFALQDRVSMPANNLTLIWMRL